ncbi:MAG: hypothetical protein IPJ98_17145 [Bryobacterales bacterium]|nr:hypothetical protein [Bryobacterales bacterium]
MATATPEIADVEIARVPRENWFRFDDAAGTELLTVVWSKKPLPELDQLIQRATLRGKTAVLDSEELVKPLTFFLEKNRVPVQVQKNEANRQTQLRTSGEVLVHQIRLEHQ